MPRLLEGLRYPDSTPGSITASISTQVSKSDVTSPRRCWRNACRPIASGCLPRNSTALRQLTAFRVRGAHVASRFCELRTSILWLEGPRNHRAPMALVHALILSVGFEFTPVANIPNLSGGVAAGEIPKMQASFLQARAFSVTQKGGDAMVPNKLTCRQSPDLHELRR